MRYLFGHVYIYVRKRGEKKRKLLHVETREEPTRIIREEVGNNLDSS